jgi:hypothetical protein
LLALPRGIEPLFQLERSKSIRTMIDHPEKSTAIEKRNERDRLRQKDGSIKPTVIAPLISV